MITIKCQIIANPVVCEILCDTCKEFADACNDILAIAMKNNEHNNIRLHHLCYGTIRNKYRLSANLVVRAIRRVSQSMTRFKRFGGKPKTFKPTSVDYDARIFSYREKDETVSLTTVRGRIHVPLKLGEYQRKYLRGTDPKFAVLKRHGNKWNINIIIHIEPPENNDTDIIGIDMGINNTIATSDDFIKSGTARQQFKTKRMKIRASLQSKGTRGCKRLLKRLSGKERRRISWENHNLSKQLIDHCVESRIGIIRMETLKNIRNRTRTWNKHLNRKVSGWSFGELQFMIDYKAKMRGIAVEYVNPAYTSLTCSCCQQQGKRNGDEFKCITCGVFHADINAAKNIARGGVVSHPELNVMMIDHNNSKAAGLYSKR